MVVVVIDEDVELCLEVADGGRCWLAAQVLLEGLVEAFDFAAGGWMVGSRVLLNDPEFDEFGFEGVAATAPAGVAGGEHHAVVGQC